MGFLKNIGRLRRIVRDSIAARKHYSSPGEAWKAAGLRYAAKMGRAGRDLAVCQLRMRSVPPLSVRRGTSDFLVVSEIFERGIYRPALSWTLPDDARVLDLGANVGLASLFFSMHWPRCRIVAVEPDADNLRMLRANCASLLDAGRLQVVEGFAAVRDGTAAIDRSGAAFSYRKGQAVGDGQLRIECVSMPTLLARHGMQRVDLLKCDIEGSEQELFADCAAWIGAVRHMVVETHSPYGLKHLYADLDRAGWKFSILCDRQRTRVGLCFLERAT